MIGDKIFMKGIILAGGSGTRLYPITKGISKQLMPIYNKPMIYYPLSILMMANIKEILIISTRETQKDFENLLQDGSNLGIHISYKIQPSPDGLAQAFILAEDFIGDDTCCMVLGDNIFYGNNLEEMLQKAIQNSENGYATIFGYSVKDPKRYGIMEIDENNKVISLEEKPEKPTSHLAITGLYFYPKDVAKKAKQVVPSKRGELEITSLNLLYLQENNLKAEVFGNSFVWFDTGTFESMMEASNFIRDKERSANVLINCPEEIAFRKNWIEHSKLLELSKMYPNSYGDYLKKLVEGEK